MVLCFDTLVVAAEDGHGGGTGDQGRAVFIRDSAFAVAALVRTVFRTNTLLITLFDFFDTFAVLAFGR